MSPRHLADEQVGEWRVSTVRLSVDHGCPGHPRWYETMVFPPDSFDDQLCWRYATAEEARLGHAWVVRVLQAGKQPKEIEREAGDEHLSGAAGAGQADSPVA